MPCSAGHASANMLMRNMQPDTLQETEPMLQQPLIVCVAVHVASHCERETVTLAVKTLHALVDPERRLIHGFLQTGHATTQGHIYRRIHAELGVRMVVEQ